MRTMPTPEIIALADEIQAHLERGALIGLAPVELGPDGIWDDAEAAARLVLADVEHRTSVERGLEGARPAPRWDDLAAQLRALRRAIARHVVVREARLRDLSEQAPAILWSTDAALRAAAVAGAGLAGLGRGPVQGRSAALAAHLRAPQGEAGVHEREWADRVYRVNVGPRRGPDGAVTGAIGAALDVTEARRAEEERAVQRERQARLEGMLFAARELASRATSNLAASSGAIDALQPEATLAPRLRAGIAAAVAGLSEAMGAIAELERLIPAPPDRPARAGRDRGRSPPER
jgi:PAS domain-containing protein